MECNERVRRAYLLAMAMQHVQQIHMNIHFIYRELKGVDEEDGGDSYGSKYGSRSRRKQFGSTISGAKTRRTEEFFF